jgi:plastocyanin
MSSDHARHRALRVALGTALATGALLLAGCGGGSSSAPASTDSMTSMSMGSSPTSSSSGGTTTGAVATVTIKDFAFDSPSSVAPGATVTVTNEDAEAHTLTADGAGGFDVKIDPGASETFTAPTKPGSYPFHCDYHSNMRGTLTVA